MASSPNRSLNEISDELRSQLFTYASSDVAVNLATEAAALKQIKRIKKSRAPGVDGFTIEHLSSLLLGGNRDNQLRDELLNEYTKLLQKPLAGSLASHRLQLFHAIKLAATPKNEEESRAITLKLAISKEKR